MTLRVIKENVSDERTHAQHENSIPTTNKFAGGIISVNFSKKIKVCGANKLLCTQMKILQKIEFSQMF